MSLVDLHLHSTFSDGIYTPTQLVKMAAKAGLQIIALTDHDSLHGIPELRAAAKKQQLSVLAGVELGSQQEGYSLHILGYGIRGEHPELEVKLGQLRAARETRLLKILQRLQQQQIFIRPEECEPSNPHNLAVGRPHVAKAMIRKGYVASVTEAFAKYLGRGQSCYVPQPKLAPEEAITLIHGAGGLAVLAHPEEVGCRSLIGRLYDRLPFDGLEVYHPSAREKFDLWLDFARTRHLLITGGSDFHGHTDRYPANLGEFKVEKAWLQVFLAHPVIQAYLAAGEAD